METTHNELVRLGCGFAHSPTQQWAYDRNGFVVATKNKYELWKFRESFSKRPRFRVKAVHAKSKSLKDMVMEAVSEKVPYEGLRALYDKNFEI